METRLKQRLIGVSVVVIATVVFLPELLRPAAERKARVVEMEIPEPPVHTFVPLQPIPARESGPIASAFTDPSPATPEVADDPPEAPAVAPPSPAVEVSPADTPPPELRSWVVQVGSFAQQANALSLRDRLRESGFATFMQPVEVGGRTLYRVRVGPELDRAEAEKLKTRLGTELGLNGQLTRYP